MDVGKNQDIKNVIQNEIVKIKKIDNLTNLENSKGFLLGKNGIITEFMKSLAKLNGDEKKEKAADINIIKNEVLDLISLKKTELEEIELNKKLAKEKIDVSLPIYNIKVGSIHPISHTIYEVKNILKNLGFEVASGNDIQSQWFNFTALNIKEDHPARMMHDTFYVNNRDENGENMVLRTHTSCVQISELLKNQEIINTGADLKRISVGKTYRSDSDATHSPMFHQLEGFYVGADVSLSHLKSYLMEFCKQFFEVDNVPLRFRPSYFPFTEPSFEVDIQYRKQDNIIKVGEGDLWLEILGCGMVSPYVFKNCGINSDRVYGFAFGVGIERLAMLKYGFSDLRKFYAGDVEFLKNYGFKK
jgi:phenylalanyl-tRNA synthetase alpha chain